MFRIRSRFLPALAISAVLCLLPWAALLVAGFSPALMSVCTGCTLLIVLAMLLAFRARRAREQALCAQLKLYHDAIAAPVPEADEPLTAEGWIRLLGENVAAQVQTHQKDLALTAKFLTGWSQKSIGTLQELHDSAARAAASLPAEGRLLTQEENTLRCLNEQLLRFFHCEEDCSLRRTQTVELSRILSDAVIRHSNALQSRKIGLRRSATRLRTESDPVLLTAILDELMDNALRHTPDSGSIGLTCREVDGQAEIVVEDAGCGIAPEELTHVFERGFVGRGENPAAAGLGLFTARAYCELLGHTISLRSAEGKGTQAILRLNIVPSEKKPDTKAEAPAQES